MPCPTCNHTMQRLSDGPSQLFWCPRCGTLLVMEASGRTETVAPFLVERCRKFAARPLLDSDRVAWRSLDIAEAIHPPEER